ncbi:MAG: zinc-dependent metalloprotease, partial [Bacteroidales bacterium]|nr:zinc-dependent metalloprotease [Bacteroidales bacterium]
MKIYKITTLVSFLLVVTSLLADKSDIQQLSAYDKIFKDKKVETKTGIVNIHKIDDKIYIEYPINLLNKDIVMGTTIEEVSDIGDSFVGQQPNPPIYLKFIMNDSIVSITVKDNYNMISEDEDEIRNSINKNTIPAILHNFSILAYTPDSSCVVFDATPFFLSDHILFRPLDPRGYNAMEGLVVRKADYIIDRSMIGDISSYSDNFSVTSYQSYNITSSLFGVLVLEKERPYTALAKRSFLFLPEILHKPRISDPRIGVYNEIYKNFSAKENGVIQRHYAKRWRLELSDTAAYVNGKLVEPIKPIMFYIDDKFPSTWIKHIKAGVERWNSAFEKIGFKNAVVAIPFPKDNPEFDPNNLKYNCIRYVPLNLEETSGPFWTDPRSGEILSANIYIYHDVSSLITMTRFIQTSAVDKSVRSVNLPESIMAESLEHVVAHEIGHCLGLAHNMAGSASYPVDSLSSPTFTQKFGTTSSIMDYCSFNYVARPGDKERGIKLTPPVLGVYDYYAIKWLYSPVLSATRPEEELETLDKWIKEKQNDPMFRYGKEQKYINYDPTCQAEDLGNDAVKSANYGIENLKTILLNANEWLGSEDPEYKFRSQLYSRSIFEFNKYVGHILANVGGVYINKKLDGDPFDYYIPVSREKQRESLLYLFNLIEDLSWMDREVQKDEIEIMASISDYCRILLIPK